MLKEMALTQNKQLGDCILDAYYEHLGQPILGNTYAIAGQDKLIQVIVFDDVFDRCRAFCSFGLSNYSSELGEVGEIVMPVSAGWNTAADIMAFTLGKILTSVRKLGWGISVNFETEFPVFARETGKHAVYLSLAQNFPETFRQFICGATSCTIYHAFLLTRAEHKYKLDHGAQALEDIFLDSSPDVFDVNRKSCL